jgi:hypothetical protein
LRPPVRAGGIIGSMIAHSSSADITRITSTSRLVRLALFVRPHGSLPAFPESAAIDRITGDSYDSRTFETGSKTKTGFFTHVGTRPRIVVSPSVL